MALALASINSCYGWKWPFLAKKHHHKIKKHNSAKTYDILIKYKVLGTLWSAFVISAKKKKNCFGCGPYWPLILGKFAQKMAIFGGFS